MVKVAWKTINGYGPYAYLQKSVKSGGKVTSKHIAYLGAAGLSKEGVALVPGKNFNAPAAADFPGGRLKIPLVGDETEAKLKPKQKAAVQYMEKQAKAGLSTKAIIAGLKAIPGKLKTGKAKKVAPVGASPAGVKAVAKAVGKPSVGASPAGVKAVAEAAGKPSVGATPVAAKLAGKKVAGPAFQPKVTLQPVNTKGELLLSSENKDKLEAAAAKGIDELEAAAKAITDTLEQPTEKSAVSVVAGELRGQILKAQEIGTDAVQKQVDEAFYKKVTINELPASKSTAETAATPKLTDVPKDSKGKPLITEANIKKLEDAAASGSHHLEMAMSAIAGKQKLNAKKEAVFAAALTLKKQIKAGAPPKESDSGTGADEGEVAPNKTAGAAAQPEPVAGPPKVTDVPLNNKGKPLVSKANIKKLEAAAAKGPDELDATAKTISDKLLHAPKKAAVLTAAAQLKSHLQGEDIQEGDGGSGLSQTIDDVDDGDVKLPKQEPPSLKKMNQQEKKLKSGTKNYDTDLEMVSGKKGSNEGGLFKDKQLETLHYVKWPNSSARAKVEALTALLYAYAKVPVPTVRVIKYQAKDAVMSDWIEDAKTMTWDEITKHKDVRAGFAADAWLANWDVVGLQADNLVTGPGNKAYRIDVGGSMIFRAQGKPKAFPADVPELETMRDSGIAPQASKAFKKLTPTQLKNGVKKVAAVTDAQIDEAVDSVKLPKKSADYPASQFGKEANDLPKMLKARLKARRDWLVEEVLEAEKKQAATVVKLQEQSDLKPASVKAIVAKGSKYQATSPAATSKWALTSHVMRTELGKDDGDDATKQTREHYDGWKGSSISAKGAVLRWGAGAMTGEGRRALRRMEKFNDFLVKEKQLSKTKAKEHAEHLEKATVGDEAEDLVEGLRVTNRQNEVIHSIQNPGKEKVTLYRGWKTPQVKYIGAQNAEVSDVLTLDDPPLYSWSLTPNVAKSFGGGHGSFVTRAEVPIDKIILSDVANSTGKFAGENEVVFKGVKKLEMEVTKTY